MVGKVGDVTQALAALQHARDVLRDRLDAAPVWQALQQLEAREVAGDPVAAIDSTALKARLAARLDQAAPGWRALSGLDAAIAALETAPIAALPTDPIPVPEAQAALPPEPAATAQALPPAEPNAGAAARNRSLADAIGAARGLPNAPPASSLLPPPMLPSVDDPTSIRAILGRIRSVSGLPQASAAALARHGEVTVHAPRPAPEPPAEAPQNPAPVAETASRHPVVPAQDAAARVAALEHELDRLTRENIAARIGKSASRSLSVATPTFAEAADLAPGDFDGEEAEVEIIAASTGDGLDTDPSGIGSAPPRGPARGASHPSRQPDGYAAYRGLVDEASVEIVKPGEQPRPERQQRPRAFRVVEDD